MIKYFSLYIRDIQVLFFCIFFGANYLFALVFYSIVQKKKDEVSNISMCKNKWCVACNRNGDEEVMVKLINDIELSLLYSVY